MKRSAWLIGALVAAGCGGGITRQELDTTKAEILAKMDRDNAEMKRELTGSGEKYVKLLEIERNVSATLEDMRKLQKQLMDLSVELKDRADKASVSSLKVLEFEEKLLADRLVSLRQMIAELKPK